MSLAERGLQTAAAGRGPLLQRDYWAVLRGARPSCSEIATLVRTRFEAFPPEALVRFRRCGSAGGLLDVGDELEVWIGMAGTTSVRVVHADANSLTLATAPDHPEAGHITFGAYRNARGDVIFHIRSRARSSTSLDRAGFLLTGEPMQTNTWTDFIDRLAHTVADGVIGAIFAETRRVPDHAVDGDVGAPTFVARGD